MKTFSEQLTQYGQQHTHGINRILHFIGMPMIIFSVLMLCNWLSIEIAPTVQIKLSWILLLVVLTYYYFLNVRLAFFAGVIFVLANIFCISFVSTLSVQTNAIVFLTLFAGGWVLLLSGHAFEKSRPAFLYSLGQLLIGPLFLLVELLQIIGLSRRMGA